MMSGYAAGFFLAALAYAVLGSHGWRLMLGLAVLPAILVWFIRRYVPEPPEITTAITARRDRKRSGKVVDQDRFVLRRLLTPPFLRSTLICTALATGSLIAFWSVSTWYPQIIRLSAAADMLSIDDGNHRVAIASMLFNAGGIARLRLLGLHRRRHRPAEGLRAQLRRLGGRAWRTCSPSNAATPNS